MTPPICLHMITAAPYLQQVPAEYAPPSRTVTRVAQAHKLLRERRCWGWGRKRLLRDRLHAAGITCHTAHGSFTSTSGNAPLTASFLLSVRDAPDAVWWGGLGGGLYVWLFFSHATCARDFPDVSRGVTKGQGWNSSASTPERLCERSRLERVGARKLSCKIPPKLGLKKRNEAGKRFHKANLCNQEATVKELGSSRAPSSVSAPNIPTNQNRYNAPDSADFSGDLSVPQLLQLTSKSRAPLP